MSSINKRIILEIQKLHNAKYEVSFRDDKKSEFDVIIQGPDESPFKDYKYKVHFFIPDDYPFKSPSIGFVTKIYHPNVDEVSGSICLDVLNQVWSPMYDIFNVVDIFIPQLLTYPNPSDPLNCEAGALYLNNQDKYLEKVNEYKIKYAILIKKVELEESDDSGDESLESLDL